MKNIFDSGSLGILSLLLALVFIPLLKKIAVSINLVDKPNYRKNHGGSVPLVGGIAIAFTSLLVYAVSGNPIPFFKQFFPILSAGIILLIVGIIDDKNDLNAKYKLVIQLLVSFIIATSGIRITSFYGLFCKCVI
jgi:UDP-GlcNAc:undecaprenyl-phosphate GlcNAc-1-phosphate transferase